MLRPIIGMIGIGKVGETLARLLYQQGYIIGAIYNRTYEKASQLASEIDSKAVRHSQDVVTLCDLIILAVSDDVIESVGEELVTVISSSKAVIHVSGASSLDVLEGLQNTGAMVGSMHPAFPFSDVEASMRGLIGATFAIEYSHNLLRDWLLDMIQSFDGHVIEIPTGKKAQYHVALVIASNYMVTLYAIAQDLLSSLSDDVDSTANKQALNALMSGTMQNLIEQGIPDALTGPLVRGDAGTIREHLKVLSENPTLYATYVNLARLSYPILDARGTDIHKIDNLLSQENTYASNDT